MTKIYVIEDINGNRWDRDYNTFVITEGTGYYSKTIADNLCEYLNKNVKQCKVVEY